MGDQRNKRKPKSQVLPTRTSSRLVKKKNIPNTPTRAKVGENEEKTVDTSMKSSLNVTADNGGGGTDISKKGLSPKARAIATRNRQKSERMKAIIAAELSMDSDLEANQRTTQFESPISEETWKEYTQPLYIVSSTGVNLESASDCEGPEPETKTKKVIMRGKPKVVTKKKVSVGSVLETIKFIVPHGLEKDTCTRVHISIKESFKEVLEKIYDGIGCRDVHQKLSLKYRINGIKGAKKMKFQSCDDWEGLLEELLIIGKGKKDLATISVAIELPDDYAENLHYTLSKKNGAKTGIRKAKKQSAQCINLNASSSDDDKSDSEAEVVASMTTKENEAVQVLKNHLGPCKSPHCKFKHCKIDKNGKHCQISWNKICIWAQALVSGKHKVTYKDPLKIKAFSNFYTALKEEPKNTIPAAETNNALGPGQYILGIPGSYPIWSPVPYPATSYPPASYPVETSAHSPKCKSSPDVFQNQPSDDSDIATLHLFQKINELFISIMTHHPKDAEDHNFDNFKEIFKKNGVKHVDELNGVSQKDFEKLFGLNWGDSRFLYCYINKSIRDTKALRKGKWATKRQRSK